MLSVIIPIYNEEEVLVKNSPFFKSLASHSQVIFVDGGSDDRSVQVASAYGKVISCAKGRATQMNHGARYAESDILLFLHADTKVSEAGLKAIEKKVKDSGLAGGCLTQRIDKRGLLYRIIESFGNIRAKTTKVFYGDQGIFVRKEVFSGLRGFCELPLMEDVQFTKRLRRAGKTAALPDRIVVSPRRWEKKGTIQTILLYSLINILFYARVPLPRIKLIYDDLR